MCTTRDLIIKTWEMEAIRWLSTAVQKNWTSKKLIHEILTHHLCPYLPQRRLRSLEKKRRRRQLQTSCMMFFTSVLLNLGSEESPFKGINHGILNTFHWGREEWFMGYSYICLDTSDLTCKDDPLQRKNERITFWIVRQSGNKERFEIYSYSLVKHLCISNINGLDYPNIYHKWHDSLSFFLECFHHLDTLLFQIQFLTNIVIYYLFGDLSQPIKSV